MIYVSPQDDLIEVVSKHLDRVKRRIWIAVYVFTLPFLMISLIKKKNEGIDVKVILSDDPLNENTVAFLRGNGIDVKIWHQSSGVLHMKLMILDDVALIGSANLTHYGLNRSLEILMEVKDQKSLRKLEKLFEGMWRISET